jgi:hypothetical protein
VFAECASAQKREDAMRKSMLLALILVASAALPASAQRAPARGGVSTETQSRIAAQGAGADLIWNFIGLIGLLGLIGLRRGHPDDSYHPSAID